MTTCSPNGIRDANRLAAFVEQKGVCVIFCMAAPDSIVTVSKYINAYVFDQSRRVRKIM